MIADACAAPDVLCQRIKLPHGKIFFTERNSDGTVSHRLLYSR